MTPEHAWETEGESNPYIALADLAINLVLILTFFVAALNVLGRAGWEQVRYREAQSALKAAVARSLPPSLRPLEDRGKNDPPGAQRWVYAGRMLFEPHTAKLTREGSHSLVVFARVLRQEKGTIKWRRIRVEGHTTPPAPGELDDWELSAARAAAVARVLHARGHIASYYLGVAGRAGQSPVNRANRADPANERVEVIVEFAQPRASAPSPTAGARQPAPGDPGPPAPQAAAHSPAYY